MQTAWDQLRPGSILLELISLINSSFPFAPSEAAKKTSARVQKPCLNPQEEDAGQAAVSLGPADTLVLITTLVEMLGEEVGLRWPRLTRMERKFIQCKRRV